MENNKLQSDSHSEIETVERMASLASSIFRGMNDHALFRGKSYIATPQSLSYLTDCDLSLEENIKQYVVASGVQTVFSIKDLATFWYWMIERHGVHLRRKNFPTQKPWTNDPILRQWFFTNPYRENDKTTEWFRTYIRDPLKYDDEVFMATIIFRWFNFIPTGMVLITGETHGPSDRLPSTLDTTSREYREHLKQSLLGSWDSKKASELLKLQRAKHEKVFTGAFMIKPYQMMDKVEGICSASTGFGKNGKASWIKSRS